MYNAFFRLAESPFSIAPDPRFVFMSARHREALAHLMYGLSGEGGFVVLTGEVGTGKTTICRCLLEQVPDDVDVAFILNPGLSAVEMLGAICDELHIAYPEGINIKGYVDRFNSYLLKSNAAGRKTVVIIDEAQLLDPKVLELLRLLTNLETSRRKLLQIVLLGQPELLALLEREDLRQVAQRVVARYHLQHLSKIEVSAYVAHRLGVAGSQTRLIPEPLMGLLYRHTGGVPRLINLVCDRALLGAYVEGRQLVTAPILRKAAGEVLGTRKGPDKRVVAASAVALVAVAAGAWHLLQRPASTPPVPVASAPATAPATAPASSNPTASLPTQPVGVPSARTNPPPATDSSDTSTAPSLAGATAVVPVAGPAAKSADKSMTTQQAAEWLAGAGASADDSEAAAFRAVLSRHGQLYSPHGVMRGCRYVDATGLRCYAGQGNTEVFQTFNLPLILYLQRNGERRAVVLDGLQGREATFVAAGQSRTAPIESLEGLWTGEYVVVWRAPPGVPKMIEPGARGPAVAWLNDALQVAAGAPPGPRSDRFDGDLQARLKAFQSKEGLEPDGVAGSLTILRLSHRVDQQLARQHTDSEPR